MDKISWALKLDNILYFVALNLLFNEMNVCNNYNYMKLVRVRNKLAPINIISKKFTLWLYEGGNGIEST